MAVTLDKINDQRYAVIPFGELLLRGKIIKHHAHSVTIKVDRCVGLNSGESFDMMIGQTHRFMRSETTFLYR